MLKHIVLFTFKPEATPAQRKQLVDGLNALPQLIPEVKRWKIEHAITGRAGRHADFALFSEFESVATLDVYVKHPEHQKIVVLVDAYCAARTGFDYE